MRITSITPYLVRASAQESGPTDRPRGRNWLFVQVQTDAGISGVGEGGGWPELVEVGVREIAPLLIGDDPRSPERVWLKIYDALHGHGLTGAVRGGVLSAIDMALWDIKGKALGVPVHELLGGAMRDRIRVYGHASTVEQAQVLLEAGYTAFKCSPSARVIAELRRAVGDDVEIGLHGHGEFSVHAAVRLAQAAEPYRPAFFEEPTSPDRPEEMAAVAQKVSVPLAAGERLFHKWSAYQLITSGSIALFQPETTRLGGVTELKKVSAIAEGAGVWLAPHDGSVGPIVEMANIHVMATTANFLYLEHKHRDVPWRHTVVRGAAEVTDGHIPLPTAPGLGVELDLEELARYPAAPATDRFTYRTRTPEQISRWNS
jgi:galactonate dehydratase